MKFIILSGKAITFVFWLLVLLSLFAVFSEAVTEILGWVGVAVLLIHFIEVAMFTKRFSGKLIEPKYDKLMVLIFGIFHILPFLIEELKKDQAANLK